MTYLMLCRDLSDSAASLDGSFPKLRCEKKRCQNVHAKINYFLRQFLSRTHAQSTMATIHITLIVLKGACVYVVAGVSINLFRKLVQFCKADFFIGQRSKF